MPDLSQPNMPTPPPGGRNANGEPAWIVRYLNGDSEWKRVRLTADEIARYLRNGRLPADAEVCGNPRDGFLPLKEHAEFAGIVSGARAERHKFPEIEPAPSPLRGSWPVFIGGITLVLLGGMALLYLLVALLSGK
jgi:hypothetical protein